MAGLKIEARAITRDIQTRAGMALAKLGCERVEKRSGPVRFLYRRLSKDALNQGRESVDNSVDNYDGVPL
jgi:hypothetical protein